MIFTSGSVPFYRDSKGEKRIALKKKLFAKTAQRFDKGNSQFVKVRLKGLGKVYVNRAHCISNSPLYKYIEVKKRPGTQLSEMVLVMGSEQQQADRPFQIKVFDNPGLNGVPIDRFVGQDIAFMLQMKTSSNRPPRFLISRGPKLTRKNAEQLVYGWIDRRHVFILKTRVGVQFNKTNFERRKLWIGRAKGYPTPIKAAVNLGHSFSEQDTPEQMAYYAMRHPIIRRMKFFGMPIVHLLYSGQKSGETGYMKKSRFFMDQIHLMVIVERTALMNLRFHLAHMADDLKQNVNGQLLQNTLDHFARQLTGKSLDRNEKLADIFDQSFGYEVNHPQFKKKIIEFISDMQKKKKAKNSG